MKPVYETERQSSNRWLIPAVLFGFLAICAVAVIVPVASLRAQEAARRAEAAERARVAANERAKAIEQGGPVHVELNPVFAAQPAVKWEYKKTLTDNASLKKAGAEGWELVTVSVTPNASGGGQSLAYFKRPLAAAPAVGVATGAEKPGM